MTEILFYTVAAEVPPLDVIVAIGSPRVTASSVEVEFVTTRPVIGARCFLRYENRNDYKDCQSTVYFFSCFYNIISECTQVLLEVSPSRD